MYETINLPKSVINLYRFASTDEYRATLRHVRIEYVQGDTMATAVATDGHRMTYLQFDTGAVQTHTGFTLIDAKLLKSLKLGRDGTAMLQLGHVIVNVKGAETRIAADYDIGAAGYPQWRQVLRTPNDDETPVQAITLDARYLADFADYLKASGLPQVLTFEMPADAMSPVALIAHDDDEAITCVVMPRRK